MSAEYTLPATDSLGRPLRELVVGERVAHVEDYNFGENGGGAVVARIEYNDNAAPDYRVRWDDGTTGVYRRLMLVAKDDPKEFPDDVPPMPSTRPDALAMAVQRATDRGIAAMDPHNDPPAPTVDDLQALLDWIDDQEPSDEDAEASVARQRAFVWNALAAIRDDETPATERSDG
jgi:hypothetical protein